ncbi:rod shape-determining protein RodA [Thioalkalivibrio paradoxus]|uniref:Peptidoglycan glycosyltransferase MrdB n=1 Tax=Thioalkalivibrio paradoxus ARh 1 TaxID=713585 RepID=W0DL07_9GAMM|nr:rod shape-determining protein RodA [Thioalkalivibrio paradoxus]AHE97932.1 cell wall shape-determining protein [Thioalkalivibrio paradoxus ARh 1]
MISVTGRELTPSQWILRSLRLDGTLLLLLVLLLALGLVVLFSATGESVAAMERQLVRIGFGLAGLLLVARIPVSTLRAWSPWLFLAALGLLIAVMVMGEIGKGARRWLDLGILRFQPSEIMKLAMPLMVAWYLSLRNAPPRFVDLIVVAVLIVVPVWLIMRQPDLGTALLVGAAGLLVVFLAGLNWRWFVGLGAAVAAAVPLLWTQMHDYQRQRVLTLLNPESDPLGAGYHIIQSKIAIGSGGLYGKGWLNGTQSQLQFLPERSTDFVFAVYAEEFGFLGVLVLLALYFLIIMRGLWIAGMAQDRFSRLIAGSISLTFAVYMIVNIGMVSGLLPVVGIPLPLVSYGGTSLVTLMVGFGILMAIHSQQRLVNR